MPSIVPLTWLLPNNHGAILTQPHSRQVFRLQKSSSICLYYKTLNDGRNL
jgi:hypothetical protein